MNAQLRSTHTILPAVKHKRRAFEEPYNKKLNLLIIRGWSITSEIHNKYKQLVLDVHNHLKTSDKLNVYFRYDLFNSTSAKYLYVIIKMMNKAFNEGKEMKIFWSFNSDNKEQMLEIGLDLSEMCDFKFEINCY